MGNNIVDLLLITVDEGIIKGFQALQRGIKDRGGVEVLYAQPGGAVEITGYLQNLIRSVIGWNDSESKLMLNRAVHQNSYALLDRFKNARRPGNCAIAALIKCGFYVHGYIVDKPVINQALEQFGIAAIGVKLGQEALSFDIGKNFGQLRLQGCLAAGKTDPVDPCPLALQVSHDMAELNILKHIGLGHQWAVVAVTAPEITAREKDDRAELAGPVHKRCFYKTLD